MNTKKYIYLIAIGAVSLVLMSGCYWLESYGKLSAPSGSAGKMTIQELEENWQDYTIYHAGVNTGFPTAIMFDPKGDERKLLTHKWWVEVKDRETVSELLVSIHASQFYPGFWRILGPDNQLYGYMYTVRWDAHIKVVDDRTMWVDELTLPPETASEPNRNL